MRKQNNVQLVIFYAHEVSTFSRLTLLLQNIWAAYRLKYLFTRSGGLGVESLAHNPLLTVDGELEVRISAGTGGSEPKTMQPPKWVLLKVLVWTSKRDSCISPDFTYEYIKMVCLVLSTAIPLWLLELFTCVTSGKRPASILEHGPYQTGTPSSTPPPRRPFSDPCARHGIGQQLAWDRSWRHAAWSEFRSKPGALGGFSRLNQAGRAGRQDINISSPSPPPPLFVFILPPLSFVTESSKKQQQASCPFHNQGHRSRPLGFSPDVCLLLKVTVHVLSLSPQMCVSYPRSPFTSFRFLPRCMSPAQGPHSRPLAFFPDMSFAQGHCSRPLAFSPDVCLLLKVTVHVLSLSPQMCVSYSRSLFTSSRFLPRCVSPAQGHRSRPLALLVNFTSSCFLSKCLFPAQVTTNYLAHYSKKCARSFLKTILEINTFSTPDRDSNLDLPIIGSLVYWEKSASNQVSTELGIKEEDKRSLQIMLLKDGGEGGYGVEPEKNPIPPLIRPRLRVKRADSRICKTREIHVAPRSCSLSPVAAAE
uniref:(California timema) hypothetical protein n=1 Tax=Timema californicum TaxID=61474 RepID=A0A7R9P387_TIMCA|nr:unnamed protein product [Timema californicum]